ncbi:unnamed protein product [Paramecium octaurelia]|uniref:Uncharacterized protein n=1 Tax=Paramecium octaurelia TaxID=43137 RepID=A0A8S1SP61_PAROT|nr:unnamed protein product [Paramecium octaurelia]
MSASKLMYSSPGPKNQSAISFAGDRDRALSPSRAKISQYLKSSQISNIQLMKTRHLKKKFLNKSLKFQKIKPQSSNKEMNLNLSCQKNNYKKWRKELKKEDYQRDQKLRNKDLKLLETNQGKELQSEKVNRKDYQQKITKTTDDRVYSLRVDIARQKNIEKKQKKRMLKKLEIEFYNYRRKLRKEGNQQVIKRLGDSILKLQEILTTEKNQREAAQTQMFKMLDEVISYLNGELNAEKMKGKRQRRALKILLIKHAIELEIH